jgi:hypothetical protein
MGFIYYLLVFRLQDRIVMISTQNRHQSNNFVSRTANSSFPATRVIEALTKIWQPRPFVDPLQTRPHKPEIQITFNSFECFCKTLCHNNPNCGYKSEKLSGLFFNYHRFSLLTIDRWNDDCIEK